MKIERGDFYYFISSHSYTYIYTFTYIHLYTHPYKPFYFFCMSFHSPKTPPTIKQTRKPANGGGLNSGRDGRGRSLLYFIK